MECIEDQSNTTSDPLKNLYTLAKLLASLNKEGLDTELINIGIQQLNTMHDDETLKLKADVLSIKQDIDKYKAHLKDIKTFVTDVKSHKKVVRGYVNGCFDLMHVGHYNSFRQSSTFGDILVVGVISDSDIEKVKGPTIFNIDERCSIVKSCKWVDEVIPDTDYTVNEEILDRYN